MPVAGVDKTVFGFEAMDYFFVLDHTFNWPIILLGTHVQQLANANILSITWQQIKAIKQGDLPKFKLKNGKEGDPSNRESGMFEILRPDRLVGVSQKLQWSEKESTSSIRQRRIMGHYLEFIWRQQ